MVLRSNRFRVLLTGCNGFTGRYVVGALQEAGYDVIGLAHESDPPRTGVLRANLLNRDAMRAVVETARAEIVVHLAAISFVAQENVDEIYSVNILGTRNLLDALTRSAIRPRIIVLASSANVYGNAAVEPITEGTPAAPGNDYAVSKLAMEHMAKLWMERLPIVITRPFNYTGIGQQEHFLLPKIVAHFRRGDRTIELGNTDVSRDFSDVRDVARAYAKIIAWAPAGQTFNICSGSAYSINEILAMLEKIAGYEIGVRVNPALVRDNEIKRLVGSCERLRKLTNFTPTIPLSETLAWMYSA